MTFTMWSFGHLLFIVSPIIFTVILQYFSKNKTMEQKQKIGIILSIIAIIILILRNIEIWVKKDYQFHYELVPLQICHFANFVLLYAFWKKSDVSFTMAFTLNLLAAFMSIVFADSLANYSTILTFRGFAYIFGHILIVVITIWAFMNDFIRISWKNYLRTIAVIEIMVLSSVIINNLMYIMSGKYSNYFYTEHPEKGTPLEWFFDWGKEFVYGSFKVNYFYVICMMVAYIISTYLVYNIAKLFNKAGRDIV